MKLILRRADGFVDGAYVPPSPTPATRDDELRALLGLAVPPREPREEEVDDADVLDVLDVVRAEAAARLLGHRAPS